MPSHDDLEWTWTAPGGEVFKGSPDYIDGCRAGWEARSWSVSVDPRDSFYLTGFDRGVEHANKTRPRCKFSSTCEHGHPDDIANHTNGETW